MIKNFILVFIIFSSSIAYASDINQWSFSYGQFDVNDSNDSSEIRFEYLSGKDLFGDMKFKPFIGYMINGDDGKYFYYNLMKLFLKKYLR